MGIKNILTVFFVLFCVSLAGAATSDSFEVIVGISDMSNPSVYIEKSLSTLEEYNTINFNCTTSDISGLDTVLFNITSPGGTLVAENNTVSFASIDYQASDGTGNFTISCWVNDTMNNINSSTDSFIVTQLVKSGGGGGGSYVAPKDNVTEENITVSEEVPLYVKALDYFDDQQLLSSFLVIIGLGVLLVFCFMYLSSSLGLFK